MKQSTLTVIALSLFGLIFQTAPAVAAIDTLIGTNSIWKYLDDGSDQGTNWITPSFNDASWLSGPGQLGYGDGDEATIVGFGPDQSNKYTTTYFRHAFNVVNPASYAVVQLRVIRDDGVVIYLNGREIFRSNLPPGPIDFATFAANASDETAFLSANIPPALLASGQNVISAEVHQSTLNSSDISFYVELTGNTQNTPPTVSLVSPSNNAQYSAPAAITINASASDPDGNLTLVEFFQGTTKLGEDSTSPYTFDWTNVPQGSYALRAIVTDAIGAKATSAVVTVTVAASSQPTVFGKSPAPGAVSSLAGIVVTFSEPVSGVHASDLLINGVPATSVAGSGTNYTFAFPQPAEGTVYVAWNGANSIVDFENPPRPLDSFAAGATWQYTLTDTVAPAITSLNPPAAATIRELDTIEVIFSEPVSGVDAADLRINNVPATSVSGSDAGPYKFQFPTPANGVVNITWSAGHGITDRAAARNPFAGGSWSYTLNTNAVWEGQIVINEIMYHPSSERVDEEWIELRNRGSNAVNLAGWRLNRAVDFVFPNTNLAAGAYLVAAANVAAFRTKYPAVANVVGGWTGRLSNTRDEVELEDASGNQVDLVVYADEGDWAVRSNSASGLGWEWFSRADGLGASLELRQAALDNNQGQNWLPSTVNNGTPGQANSVASTNIPPMILNVTHFPAIPHSTNTITILARIVDENASGLTVRLWRRDATTTTPPSFTSVAMLDNGLSNDGAAGDGLYGVVLPPMANGTITEFYIEAVDASSNTRTWPAAADMGGGSFAQEANAFFQVDDEAYTGKQSIYRISTSATPSDKNVWN